MNKKLRYSLIAVFVLICTMSFADAYKTLTFPDGNSGKISSYEKTWTVTLENFTWTIKNFNNNNNDPTWKYIKCGRKNYASVAYIETAQIDKAISSVVVTIDAITANKVNSISLIVASDAAFTNVVETIDAKELTKGDMVFDVTKTGANLYYQLKFDCQAGSSNGLVQVSKVVYNAIVGPEFSFDASEATATIGEDFTAPTLTNTYEEQNVTYLSSEETVATVDAEGKVTPLSVGTTVITATLASDATVTASYTLTVKEAGLKTMTLSIAPEAGTYPAAQTVTLTSSYEGAKIYYTTDGTEPTTESAEYTAAIPVTISGTTVKALAVAEGYETARTEAAYTIKPDQPKFSEESKTFKDPLAVTLTLPETASSGAKIHYAIDATATAESDVYDGTPITISGKNDGDKIILHAVVVDEYGNVGTEKFCTYTYSDAIIFDFTANPNVWGIEPINDNRTTNTDGKNLEVAGVVLTTTSGTGQYKTCIYGTSSYALRLYNGSTITLTAPANYEITSVTFTGSSLSNLKEETTGTAVSTNNNKWEGNAQAITFVASGSCQIKTISVTLQKVADAPTSATLNFVAQNADGYYATFSSDKDVVFTRNVIVYAANVNGTAVKLNALASDLYEVTDATAGESGLLDGGYYVPANTGVLVYSIDETTTTYYFPAETAEVQLPANMLEAATADGVFEGKDGYCYYKLAYNDYTSKTDLGFYYGAADGAPFAVKKGLAYLAVPTTSGAAPARFVLGGDTDAISSVNSDVENAETVIYTIAGQRVGTATKPGLYIVNGKKLIVK